MNEIDKKTEDLIASDLLGELDGMSSQELENWLQKSDSNQKQYSERKKIWDSLSTLKKMEMINEKKAFQKVSYQLFSNPQQQFLHFFQRVAAILILPIIFGAIWLYVAHNNETNRLSSVYQTAQTPMGMRSNLILPDGTKVWLNAGSSIRYPVYSEHERRVEIEGEVYFEVKKIKDHPFIIHTGAGIEIEVLGTKFNCYAYPESNFIQTVLVEGSVKITNTENGSRMMMSPGELVEYTKSNHTLLKSKTNIDKYIAWKSGRLLFRDDPMNVVIEKLERWYNIDIQVVDEQIRNYVYTATFENETLEQVLVFLKLSAPIDYFMPKRERNNDGTFAKQIIKLYNKS